jgi:hypothetical protein
VKRKNRFPLRGREWLLLATSLLLAVLIWFLSNLARSYSGVLGVPVVAECNIQGHSNVSSNSAMLSARCRADGYRLLREGTRRSRRPVRVVFDRADLRYDAGDRFFVTGNVMNNYLRQIFGDEVDVEDIITDTLFFTFAPENNKRVPVHFAGDFSYRSQYMASGPLKITPDSVTVYGEKARLDLVDYVSTAQIFPDDVHDTQHGVLRLRRIKGVRFSDDEVSYDLPVARYVEMRSELPVTVRNVPKNHRLDVLPSRATVVLHCTFSAAHDPFNGFALYIDYEDFASSLTGSCVPRVEELPAGVLDYRVEPAIFYCVEVGPTP